MTRGKTVGLLIATPISFLLCASGVSLTLYGVFVEYEIQPIIAGFILMGLGVIGLLLVFFLSNWISRRFKYIAAGTICLGIFAAIGTLLIFLPQENHASPYTSLTHSRPKSVVIAINQKQQSAISSLPHDLVCFTPRDKPIQSLEGLSDEQFASYVRDPGISQKLMAAFGRQDTVVGLRTMGTGGFHFDDNPNLRLFITHSSYTDDIVRGGGIPIEFTFHDTPESSHARSVGVNSNSHENQFVVDLPIELTRIGFPSGNILSIELADISVSDNGWINVQLDCSEPLTNQMKGDISGAAVLYVTKHADLQAAAGDTSGVDFSGPAGIVLFWFKTIANGMTSQISFEGYNGNKQITGGITQFNITQSNDRQHIVANGELPPSLQDLWPQAIGLVLVNGSQPISNFIWAPVSPSDTQRIVRAPENTI
ncbi:hypothetical protein JXA32_02925 [Candidatus Sumerlaeota bacterium]|nr:hypothetical protein [Candidatus Sumerlaeota bacterium]